MRVASTGKQARRVVQEMLINGPKSKHGMIREVRCTIGGGGGTQGSTVETRRCGGVLEVIIEL